jgi:hypothetical protein
MVIFGSSLLMREKGEVPSLVPFFERFSFFLNDGLLFLLSVEEEDDMSSLNSILREYCNSNIDLSA